MAAIFFVSGQSQPQIPGGISNTTGHVLAYGGLGVLVVRALARGLPARVSARIGATAVAIAVAYGTSDEVHQMFVPGRMPDVYDVIADAGGALIAVAACWAWGILSSPEAPATTPKSR
jgi:VanZ family protein